MQRSEKHALVESFRDELGDAEVGIVVHYQGMNVAEATEFRRKVRAADAKFVVIKNRLAKISVKDTKFSALEVFLTGPTGIALSKDPVTLSKVIVDHSKSSEALKVIGGVVSDNVLNAEAIKIYASLPSLDELRSKIISLINAPATKLASVISAGPAKLARVISAYSKK